MISFATAKPTTDLCYLATLWTKRGVRLGPFRVKHVLVEDAGLGSHVHFTAAPTSEWPDIPLVVDSSDIAHVAVAPIPAGRIVYSVEHLTDDGWQIIDESRIHIGWTPQSANRAMQELLDGGVPNKDIRVRITQFVDASEFPEG